MDFLGFNDNLRPIILTKEQEADLMLKDMWRKVGLVWNSLATLKCEINKEYQECYNAICESIELFHYKPYITGKVDKNDFIASTVPLIRFVEQLAETTYQEVCTRKEAERQINEKINSIKSD